MAGIKVYSLEYCPVCIKLRKVFAERGIDYEDILVDDDEDLANEVVLISGQTTAPVIIWQDGRVEVGLDGEEG